ncbi:hypothetical protein EIN_184750 [Entamoeba invadens IP1]|uniref:hypothetical protein n=1 Tax=Entamoeba invadens IP1 TaxID=370355 RepID=UPI0002C3D25D|nr:hypothetical protein EIN_184750 [Entamoeba invadens IP1]ELP94108.1 hypothetical protein EIN_184750 [Entamoeba invadens IP1]|eukprot:XP_004260879.1 hypothetical protein EIN_184750 [Entamoeba invadens IP1]
MSALCLRQSTVAYCAPVTGKTLSECVQSKRDMKNFESIQQCLLLGLLSRFGTFVLERPVKKSKVTFQFVKVQNFTVKGETIEIAELVESVCKQRSTIETCSGVPADRVKRRYDKNRFIFLSNFLLDLALEFGYFFDSKLARNTGGSIQLEKIRNVFFEGKCIFGQEEMMKRGIALNKYFISLTQNPDKVGKINLDDPTVDKILKDPINFVETDWDVQIQERKAGKKKRGISI